ncbi:hypothetical protein N2152v2_002646, partial [Parachlorella kessleri]
MRGALAVLTVCAVLLLVAAVTPAQGASPFSETKSKEEAVAAFAEVARALAKKDANGLQSLYASWKKVYAITYPASEDARRYNNFVTSVRRIIANNLDARTSHWSGLNRFSALSDQEFRAQFSTALRRTDTQVAPGAAVTKFSRSLLQTLPAYKDWAREGKVTAVRNQGGCGCCWAFAGAAAIESRALIALKKTNATFPIDVAEQQIVNCARGAPDFPYSFGCGGGQLEDPYRFAA